ncbi:hypothetical protein, partial [Vibrio breoganii]|uniref:hypothetical protein n=1 Tax=Vibrio breoganii TaxID=553239 RepID=UPI0018E42F81
TAGADQNAYVDPEMVQGMVNQNAAMLGQQQAGLNASAAQGGNAGSSRAGLASGAAAAGASAALTGEMTDYYNQQIDRASGDIKDAEAGFIGNVGKDVQYLQYLRELQQGDANAKWMGELMESNPAMLQALIYASVANSSPLGSTVIS